MMSVFQPRPRNYRIEQKDLKYGRRPFDWYRTDGSETILRDDLRIQSNRLR